MTDQSEKSFGQIGYEAYVAKYGEVATTWPQLPKWNHTWGERWERWEAAAKAVAEAATAPLRKRIAELEAEVHRLLEEKAVRLNRYRISKCSCGGSIKCDGSCDRCQTIVSQ